ncbi:MAG: EamA family transporter [Actinobacteria bacterium]|nr:EamA family transporter [Actinomycetota bacterium]
MSAILALISSLMWGAADFLGGNLTKKYKAVAVTAASQSFGLLIGVFVVIFTSSWKAPTFDWNGYVIPGVLAGTMGFIGLVAFYASLASGRMGVVSPISALSVFIPLTIAFISGEKPTTLQFIGIAVALVGGFCATGPELKGGSSLRPIIYAVIAAFSFGSAVAFITKGSQVSPIMTMTTMRSTTFIFAILLVIRFRTLGGFKKSDIRFLFAIGAADFFGNLLLGIATTKGLVSLAVVLGSLYPIVTSLLAFKFLNERLHRIQYFGIVSAIIGIVFISAG